MDPAVSQHRRGLLARAVPARRETRARPERAAAPAPAPAASSTPPLELVRVRLPFPQRSVDPCRALPSLGEYDVVAALAPRSFDARLALDFTSKPLPVPPAWARRALTVAHLRPADLGWWVADLSPWAAYAALKFEQRWDSWDSNEANARYRANSEKMEAWWASEGDRRVGDEALAQLLSESDDPAVAVVADALQLAWGALPEGRALELLLASDTPPTLRAAVSDRFCRNDALDLDRAARDALRAVTSSAEPDVAVRLAILGLSRARGTPREATLWWSALEDSTARCREAEPPPPDPRSFDGVPPAYGPAGFEAAAERAGARAGMELVEVDCDRFPCLARFRPGQRRADPTLQGGWPNGSVAMASLPGSWSREAVAVAVPGRRDPREVHRALRDRSGPALACPSPAQLDAIRGDLSASGAVVGGSWRDALVSAAHACSLDIINAENMILKLGALDSHLIAEAAWVGGWRFEPPDAFLDCVAARATGPAPPAGARVRLDIAPDWRRVTMGKDP
jgi:hypothetical protein